MTHHSETTYLIDGSGYIFRAFYAIQRLSTSTGFPTNALYGFVRMLLKTLTLANSSRVAIIFDAGKKTFRNDLYQEYKANRRECPAELVEQMPYFRELSRALGLPVLELPGYEADDIIATLTKELSSHDGPVVIVSGDKDLMQLVSEKVQIWDTMKEKRYGIPDVVEKFGVGPAQVTEILALTGDTSDNVPGVSGIGPKTATQLIQKYQSVEGVIANLEAIKEDSEVRNRKKIAEAIESNVEQLRLSRKLVEVLSAVPLSDITVNEAPTPAGHSDGYTSAIPNVSLHALLTRRDADATHLRELFERFEFSTLYKEFQHILGSQAASRSVANGSYETVLADQFDAWCAKLLEQKEFAFDVETTSLDVHAATIVGASFCWESDKAFYIPLRHTVGENQVTWDDFVKKLGPVFADPDVRKVGQNCKYDMSILEVNGVPVRGISFDTMIAAYVINPDSRSFNLTALSHDFLQRSVIEYDEVTQGCSSFADVAIDAATQYAGQDAHYAWLLKEILAPRVASEGLTALYNEVEVPLIPVLAAMERRGIKVDLETLKEMSADFEAQLRVLETQIFNAAGKEFNINSPKQLGEVLFTDLALPTKGLKKTKTGISTDSSVLEKLAESHPLPALVLEYRTLHKLKSTYTDALVQQINPVTGRVHTKFNQAVTGTGRLSSSDPNLQNIPVQSAEGRRIRSAFVPESGRFFIAADYSQIELRLLAHLSNDENLIRAFAEGADIHARTAREILGIGEHEELPENARRIGKTINFGIVYGMGAFRLGRELGIPVHQASQYITNYFNRYPRVKDFFARLEEAASSQGEVQTLFGRKRVISSIDTSGRDQGFAMRAAINAPLQGSAADIIKVAMIRVAELLRSEKIDAELILQIHDELLIEAKDHGEVENKRLLQRICDTMEHVIELKVPLKVEAGAGYSWQEAQS